jgi:hypothetical protein
MLAVSLVFGTLVAFMAFFVGGMVGWTAREYLLYNSVQEPSMHPEMYDEDGNVLADSLIAFRFTYDDELEDED